MLRKPFDNPSPPSPEDLQKQIEAAVEAATKGLKSTNTALKEEKTKLAEQMSGLTATLEQLGGADGVKQLLDYRKKLSTDELGKLLAEGKHDEWFDRRTTALRGEYDGRYKNLESQFQKEQETSKSKDHKIERMALRQEVNRAAMTAIPDVDSGTVDDIYNAAEKVFKFDPTLDRLVIKDKDTGVITGKDGKTPKTMDEWLEDQKTVKRRWWGPSTAAGLNGNNGDGGSYDSNPWSAEHWNMTKQGEVVKGLGMDRANAMAKAAGTTVGGPRPRAKVTS